jgi:hypothetical protein
MLNNAGFDDIVVHDVLENRSTRSISRISRLVGLGGGRMTAATVGRDG